MARLAKKTLNVDKDKLWNMHVIAELPLITPFSCVLDGIQAATKCTIGNGKLEVKNSSEAISAIFRLKGQDKAIKFTLKKHVIEMLEKQFSKGGLMRSLPGK